MFVRVVSFFFSWKRELGVGVVAFNFWSNFKVFDLRVLPKPLWVPSRVDLRFHKKCVQNPSYLKRFSRRLKHTFSAFWLRSSVVSVLISLISGTSTIVGNEY